VADSGRKQTLSPITIYPIEWPLSVKADAQNVDLKNQALSGCFTPESSHSRATLWAAACDPKATFALHLNILQLL